MLLARCLKDIFQSDSRAAQRIIVQFTAADQHGRTAVQDDGSRGGSLLDVREGDVDTDQSDYKDHSIGEREILPQKGLLSGTGDDQQEDEVKGGDLRQASAP